MPAEENSPIESPASETHHHNIIRSGLYIGTLQYLAPPTPAGFGSEYFLNTTGLNAFLSHNTNILYIDKWLTVQVEAAGRQVLEMNKRLIVFDDIYNPLMI